MSIIISKLYRISSIIFLHIFYGFMRACMQNNSFEAYVLITTTQT